jgi:hypothetical protein
VCACLDEIRLTIAVRRRGEADLDKQAATVPSARPDVSAVGGGDGINDGQAQTVAAVVAHAPVVGSQERARRRSPPATARASRSSSSAIRTLIGAHRYQHGAHSARGPPNVTAT